MVEYLDPTDRCTSLLLNKLCVTDSFRYRAIYIQWKKKGLDNPEIECGFYSDLFLMSVVEDNFSSITFSFSMF